MKKNKGTQNGFTLIELMVVISIMLIILSMSVASFMGFIGPARIKSAGIIIQTLFDQVAQTARSERITLFVYFDVKQSTMIIYRDTDDDGLFTEADKVLEDRTPIRLPSKIEFYYQASDPINQPPPQLFAQSESKRWVGFTPYGSLILPEGVLDVPFFDKDFNSKGTDPTQDNIIEDFSKLTTDSADIVVWEPGTTKRVLLDFFKETAKVRMPIYISK
ncbi:MAG: type II secretion system protein [Planctomycetes bacterium]|nr:type II secretion system protein [Planctomycetota bacterium]